MSLKKIQPADVMGENYYIYKLQVSSNIQQYNQYVPAYFYVFVIVTDVYGRNVENKTVSLYLDGALVTPNKTTDSGGYANWELTVNTSGLHILRCGNDTTILFVDNKSEKDHTHTQYLTSSDITGKIDTAGSGLSKNGTTLNHTNNITALTTTSLKKIKYDGQGHITGTNDVSSSDLPAHQHTTAQITNFPTIPSKTSDLTNDSGFLTSHQDISGKENISNRTTVISSGSTNYQYPTAKAVYDLVGNIISIINGTGE